MLKWKFTNEAYSIVSLYLKSIVVAKRCVRWCKWDEFILRWQYRAILQRQSLPGNCFLVGPHVIQPLPVCGNVILKLLLRIGGHESPQRGVHFRVSLPKLWHRGPQVMRNLYTHEADKKNDHEYSIKRIEGTTERNAAHVMTSLKV